MVLAHPENEPLMKALKARDADAVNQALLTATLVVPAVERPDGGFGGSAQRAANGALELSAYTSASALKASGTPAEHVVSMLGGDVVNMALRIGADVLRLDPGQPHSGTFAREALVVLHRTFRGAGTAPMMPPGDWATQDITDAARGVVHARPDLAGVWLCERDERPSIVLDTRAEDPTAIIQAMVEALKPVVGGMTIDFVLLDEGHRAEAEGLGPAVT